MEFLTQIKGIGLIAEFLIKSTVILTLSFSLVFLLRKKSATLKHFLLSVSLICLLLLPVFSTFSQGWETRLLPSWTKAQNSASLTDRPIGFGELSSQYGLLNPINDKSPLLSAVTKTKNNPASKTAWSSGRGNLAGQLLLAVWAAGLLFLVARIFLGLYGAFKLTRQGKTVTGLTWRQLLLHFLQAVSIKRKISLLSHRQVKVPMTWGVFKPVVIVPAESKNWTRDECSSALFHELSHIKRGDFMVKILARLSCALYWFNPLSWFALRMIKKEQEKACDELVLKAGVKPSTYAENLLAIKKAGRMGWNPPSAALGAVGKSQLNERLLAILKQQLCPKEVKMKTKILLSTFVILSMVFIGLARPSASAAQSEKGLVHEEKMLAQAQPVIPDAPLPVQEEQEEKQKQTVDQKKKEAEQAEKEKADQKTEEKKKITWVTKDGKTIDIYISSEEDEEGKQIHVTGDMEIHIDKDSDKRIFTIRLPHEHLKLTKNEEGEWTIEADKIELQHGDMSKALSFALSQSLNLPNKLNYSIRLQKGEGEESYYVVTKPYLELKNAGKLNIHLARPDIKLEVLPDLKDIAFKNAKVYTLHHPDMDTQEVNKKLEEIREKLKQVREKKDIGQESRDEMLEEIEEMLKELSETLKIKKEELKDVKLGIYTDAKKLEELKDIEVGIVSDFKELTELKDIAVSVHAGNIELQDMKDVAISIHGGKVDAEDLKGVVYSIHPKTITVGTNLDGVEEIIDVDAGTIYVKKLEGGHPVIDVATDKMVVGLVEEGEGEFQILIKADLDEDNLGQYEEAVAKIKEKLGETYTVESEIDEDKGTITIKIKGITGEKGTKISIKKLIEDIKEELSHIKGL